MWTILGGLAALAGLLILAIGIAALFRQPSTPVRGKPDIAPGKQSESPPPRQELPTPLSKKLDTPARDEPGEPLLKQADAPPSVEIWPTELPREAPVPAQRRREPRFELIPHKMAGINARSVLSEEIWAQLSKVVIRSHGGKCSECPNDPATRMECHEVWKYEWVQRPGRSRKVGVMKLIGLRPLCHLCHMGKHIKFAESQGELPEVTSHLMKLYDGLSAERIGQLMLEAVGKSELKYKYEELDLTYLNDARFAWLRARIGRDFTANEMSKPVAA